MDEHLKRLAEVGLELTAAEQALDEGANTGARAHVDAAEEGLDALRAAWPGMSQAERQLVGRTAAPLRERLDAARRRLPRATALVEVAPEPGEEDDDGPYDDDGGPSPNGGLAAA
jgi:hypothetical protein